MPALALDVVTVHHPLVGPLVVAERAGLFQENVDQGGLAVVNVCDDGDIAQLHAGSSKRHSGPWVDCPSPLFMSCLIGPEKFAPRNLAPL